MIGKMGFGGAAGGGGFNAMDGGGGPVGMSNLLPAAGAANPQLNQFGGGGMGAGNPQLNQFGGAP